jgi:hypothetical protein
MLVSPPVRSGGTAPRLAEGAAVTSLPASRSSRASRVCRCPVPSTLSCLKAVYDPRSHVAGLGVRATGGHRGERVRSAMAILGPGMRNALRHSVIIMVDRRSANAIRCDRLEVRGKHPRAAVTG